MKYNKLYVAVKTGYNGHTPLFTLLSVDKMSTIKNNIPTDKEIDSYIKNQYRFKGDNEFNPLQLKVSNEAFELIKKEVRGKINSNLIYNVPSIDLVMSSETLPVIQIIK